MYKEHEDPKQQAVSIVLLVTTSHGTLDQLGRGTTNGAQKLGGPEHHHQRGVAPVGAADPTHSRMMDDQGLEVVGQRLS